jgi:hypothetical protein
LAGQAIRLATDWSQVWREPGGNVTASSLQLNDTAGKRLELLARDAAGTRNAADPLRGYVTTRARGSLALPRLSLPRAALIESSFKSSVGSCRTGC